MKQNRDTISKIQVVGLYIRQRICCVVCVFPEKKCIEKGEVQKNFIDENVVKRYINYCMGLIWTVTQTKPNFSTKRKY